MQSFRTELETAPDKTGKTWVEKDIIDLEKKIRQFSEGKIDPEKFRSLRLARGVYGQRQQGVQMVRIKLPLGKISPVQLTRIANISDEYSNGRLHLTTRQDVQIHYVSLDKTPELWAKLEQDDITLREACGNTVRNITASPFAGIDPHEAFDVSPYAEALFRFFLRNPVQENLGRKFKIAFSSGEEDTAYTFIHDLGFIPKIKIENGELTRGFKVLVGGGLGAQPLLAQTAYEFLPADELIRFSEAVLRVFDRYGERNNRHKARLKYLLAKTGLQEFLNLVEQERSVISHTAVSLPETQPVLDTYVKGDAGKVFTTLKVSDNKQFHLWKDTNVFEQKQQDFFAVGIRVPLGNLSSEAARKLAEIAQRYSAGDLRITVNQGFLLRFVPGEALPALYRELHGAGLALPGFDSVADITTCPGTDTCNLGITNTTGISDELSQVIQNEFSDLLYEKNIKIKISGCMNSCGQHSLAHIGFHGSSLKAGTSVVPALQVLLGGGASGDGAGRISDKVIKVPSKRGPAVLRELLNDFEKHAMWNETFNQYFDRQGNDHFFRLLRPHADLSALLPEEYRDWGYEEAYKPLVGVGECAGVQIDLVATLFFEADEKIDRAVESLSEGLLSDAVYHAYSAYIQAAKALLLTSGVQSNTQYGILSEFDKRFLFGEVWPYEKSLKDTVLQINTHVADKEFAAEYLAGAQRFVTRTKALREELLNAETETI